MREMCGPILIRWTLACGICLNAISCGSSTDPSAAVQGAAATQSTRQAERLVQEKPIELRHVDATILGQIVDVRGVDWPRDARTGAALSAGREDVCEVRLHLPGGRTLSLKTRPVLTLTRALDANVVMQASLPPAAPPGPLRKKIEEIESLLKEWDAKPNPRMRALLDEFRGYPATTAELGYFIRIGAADLDEKSEVLFELSGDSSGKYYIVAVISAKAAEWDRIRNEWHARAIAASRPTEPSPALPQK